MYMYVHTHIELLKTVFGSYGYVHTCIPKCSHTTLHSPCMAVSACPSLECMLNGVLITNDRGHGFTYMYVQQCQLSTQ